MMSPPGREMNGKSDDGFTSRNLMPRESGCYAERKTSPTPMPGSTVSCAGNGPPAFCDSWRARRWSSLRRRSITNWLEVVSFDRFSERASALADARSWTGGFDPHIDANAYTHVKDIKHLTILAAVDEMNSKNGGLDVVVGSHRMEVTLGSDRCIDPTWVDSHVWTPVDLQPGTCETVGVKPECIVEKTLIDGAV